MAARQALKAVLTHASRDVVQSCITELGSDHCPPQDPTGAAGTKDQSTRGLHSAVCCSFCCLACQVGGDVLETFSWPSLLQQLLPAQVKEPGGLPTAIKHVPIMHLGTGEINIEGLPDRNF